MSRKANKFTKLFPFAKMAEKRGGMFTFLGPLLFLIKITLDLKFLYATKEDSDHIVWILRLI